MLFVVLYRNLNKFISPFRSLLYRSLFSPFEIVGSTNTRSFNIIVRFSVGVVMELSSLHTMLRPFIISIMVSCAFAEPNATSFDNFSSEPGNAHKPFLTDDCKLKTVYINATFHSEPNSCSPYAYCGRDAYNDETCLCYPGFSGDGYNCTDVNECLDPKLCSVNKNQGTCTNTVGSYYCQCEKFFNSSGCQYYHPRRHCADLYKYWGINISGVHTINPPYAMGSRPAFSDIEVYCDMESEQDGKKGGWTLMSHDFGSGMVNKTLEQYEIGFGSSRDQNVWLGLQIINGMTQEINTSLLLNLHRCAHQEHKAKTTWCNYKHFSVAGSANNYSVTIPEVCKGSEHEYYDGWARWDLTKPGPQFIAYDTPKPESFCSETFQRTGWWFDPNDRCGAANLNGARYSCDNMPVGSDGATYLFWSGSPLGDAWLYLRPTAYPNYDPHPVTPMS